MGKITYVKFIEAVEIGYQSMSGFIRQGDLINQKRVSISLPEDARFLRIDFENSDSYQLIPLERVMTIHWTEDKKVAGTARK
jgi:hypothetical protein